MKVQNKTAIVTGAASGIGRGVALALAKRNCNLALVDYDEEHLAETREQLSGYPVRITTYRADLSDRNEIDTLPGKILADHQAVDLLFNVAGIAAGGHYLQLTDETIERVMRTNFFSQAYMMKRFLPILLERPEGHVINVASSNALAPLPGDSVYAATKAGVHALTNALVCELDGHNVHFTVVFPGGVHTGIIRNAIQPTGLTEEQLAERRANLHEYEKKLKMSPEKAGEDIVRGTEKNRRRILTGDMIRIAAVLNHFCPDHYWTVVKHIVKK